MSYIIRDANIMDLKEIMLVISDAKELFKNSSSDQWQDKDGYPNIKTFINDLKENKVLVITDKEKVVGVIVISLNKEPAYENIYQGKWLNDYSYAVIHRLAIKKEYYRLGLAKELLDEAEKYIIDNNIYDIRVDTHEKNIAMQNLLESKDYHYVGVIYLNRKDVLSPKRLAYHKIIKRSIDAKAIMLIHGFLSDMSDFDIIIPALEFRYDCVYQIVLPGHGIANNYDYNSFTKDATFKKLIEDFDKLSEKYQIVDVLGYSMGGALASFLSTVRSFRKLILLAPANKYFNPKSFLYTTEYSLKVLTSLEKAAIKKTKAEQEQYKELLKAATNDTAYGISFIARKFLRTYIWKAYQELKDIVLTCNKDLKEIKNETLICWGELDQMVPKSSVDFLFSICTNNNKKLIIYEGITHIMLNSKNNGKIVDDILEFIDN